MSEQTYVFWALSTLIFLLTVLLSFILFRDAIKLYIARRAGVEGSKIRTKILACGVEPVFPADDVPGVVERRGPQPQPGQVVQSARARP